MAATVSGRRVDTHGSLRKELGTLVYTGAGSFRTKLGRVTFFEMTPTATSTSASFTGWINSNTASAVQDDPGTVHISSASNGLYSYCAIGAA